MMMAAAGIIGAAYTGALSTGDATIDAVERFHFVEYGAIAVLFYRAWRKAGDGSTFILPLLAGFIVGVVERSRIAANGVPAPGDLLIGLPSSGLHTNGYSLARRVLPPSTWAGVDPALGMSLGEVLLIPHRSYLDDIQALIAAGARGFAHITGGGLPENVARALPPGPCQVLGPLDLAPAPTGDGEE